MQFVLSEDQRLLADGVTEFLAGECTPDRVREAWDAGGYDRGRWKALAEMGVIGLTVPTEHGGLGMDDRDLVTLLVEAGRAALPEPVLEVTAVAAPLLAEVAEATEEVLDDEVEATWLPRIAAGEAVVVPVLEGDPYPAHVAAADLLLVARGDELFAVPPHSVEIVPQASTDLARPTASVALPHGAAPIAKGEGVAVAIDRALSRGAAAAAAMLVGTGLAMIDQAVEYAKQREQFGKPIGSFQAVKHHLATAFVEVQFCRPLVERAASSLATDDPDAALHASLAKAMAAEAAQVAAKAALQVHGAIGYTWECDLQLWMKRAWSLSAAWGDTEHHWQVADAAVVG